MLRVVGDSPYICLKTRENKTTACEERLFCGVFLMAFCFGPCISFLFRTTPIIVCESACVNNFVEDYLGNKYHVNCPQFSLVSEHEGGTLDSFIKNRLIGESVWSTRWFSREILKKICINSEYKSIGLFVYCVSYTQ